MASSAPITSQPMEGQSASPARASVEIIAITTRDDFLLELGEALNSQAAVRPVESATQALESFGRSKQVQLLMVDSRDIADVRAEMDLIERQEPHAVAIVFASADSEQTIATALKGSLVFAVLPVPVDVSKTAAVFGGALAAARDKQSAPRQAAKRSHAAAAVEMPAASEMSPLRPEPREPAANSSTPRIVIAALLAVLVAGALWYFTRTTSSKSTIAAKGVVATTAPTQQTDAAATAPLAEPAVETSVLSGKVDDLLEKARLAMRERRYTEPAGNNALLYYRSATAADKANGEALDGLRRLATVLSARFDEAMTGAHLEEAALALAQFKSAAPADSRVATMETRVTAARKELAKAQEEARQKHLAEEEQAKRETQAAEQRRAREAKAAAEAEHQAQLAREKEQQEKLNQEQAAALAAKAAAQSTAIRSPSALQNNLKRKRYVAPEYPRDALAKRVGGVVTIGFTVNVKGEPRDIQIVSSEPAGVFDLAATDAVKHWRYEPMVVDGTPTEVPVRMAIRFAPPN